MSINNKRQLEDELYFLTDQVIHEIISLVKYDSIWNGKGFLDKFYVE